MNKLKKEELLKKLNEAFEYLPLSIANGQAHRQIKELIQKPGVTEEWIEEKAIEIYNLSYYKSFKPEQIADCLHSLIEDFKSAKYKKGGLSGNKNKKNKRENNRLVCS